MLIIWYFVACMKNKITRLVYTSTYNVIFGGQEIKDGDDSLPYLPLNQVTYSILLFQAWYHGDMA